MATIALDIWLWFFKSKNRKRKIIRFLKKLVQMNRNSKEQKQNTYTGGHEY